MKFGAQPQVKFDLLKANQLNEYFKTDYDYTEIRRCYNGEEFTKFSSYEACRMYFRNLEDCQKVCDYLNKDVSLI